MVPTVKPATVRCSVADADPTGVEIDLSAFHPRQFRATIHAMTLCVLLPFGFPTWMAGLAVLWGAAIDAGFFFARWHGEGLLSAELANAAINLLPAVCFALDESGDIRYWNNPFAKLAGTDDAREAVFSGTPLYRFFDGTSRTNMIVAVAQALNRGYTTVEARVGRKDEGVPMMFSILRVKVWGTFWLIGVGQDVSARKEAEAELRRQEKQYRLLAEHVTDVVAHIGPDAHVRYVSPSVESMLGYEPEELSGTSVLDLVHPDDKARAEHIVRYAMVNGEPHRAELRLQKQDGKYLWVESMGKELREDGVMRGLVISTRDISERKAREVELDTVAAARRKAEQAREEAERANELKSSFLANMSHEIRTPLTSIIGFAEAIGEEIEELKGDVEHPSLDALHRFAYLIENGGRRLMDTLKAVLNLSKLESGEMEMTLEPVDLTKEVHEAAALYTQQAEEQDLQLEVETDSQSVWAEIDRNGLHIVLRNLLSNAIKYTEGGGQVWIRTRQEEEAAVLEVEDTGVGMDPDEVPTLFDAFRQGSEGLSREYEGSGLGLAVLNRVTEKMNGSIEVETEEKQGSRFIARLPPVVPVRQ